ncbi:MAG: NPCBM/NEW2 domain-containing protein [Firmicutes bacterium]|nr:NPCBM/NEW2 domain-containing protein [Bacillota bacterium]
MKQRLQGLIAGITIGALCAGGIAYAKSTTETIEVTYSDIRVYTDGEEVDMKDANGQSVEPFIYNGTTYLPVRAVGEAVGKEVSWDGVEKVVYLGAKPGETENWLDVCGPYEYVEGHKEYRLTDNEYFTMSGNKYTNGFTLGSNRDSAALFNLNGKYESLSFTVGHVDGSAQEDATLNIYLDGIIAYTKDLKYEDVATKVTVPLNNALQMKIEVTGGHNFTSNHYGFSEGIFE